MKYTYLLWLVSILLINCTSQHDEFQSTLWQEVQATSSGEITLLYVPSEGFSYINEDGQLTGVTIELMKDFRAFAENKYGVSLSLHFEPIESFTDFYDTVVTGSPGLFGVANVTITEERRDELTFSPSYLSNIAVLITRDEIEKAEQMSDISQHFSGLNGLAFQGTLHETRIDNIVETYLPDAEIDYAHSNAEIIDRVAEENRYFAYVDIYNFYRAAERGAPLLRHEVGDEASEEFGVIMPLGSDWSKVMNHFFEHDGGYVHSESYHAILRNHLGDELAELLIEAL